MDRHKILVVDDELLIRDLLYDFFITQDWDITVAEDGQRALDYLASERFDAVLTDLKMPGLDGMELITRIRDVHKYLPIIIMTGYPSLESALDALRQKVADYIIKPFNINQLFKAVKKAIDEWKDVNRQANESIQSGT
jgi:DNA-binding NtrC family response regulator